MNREEHKLSTTLRSCYCTPFNHFPTSFVQIVECQFNYYIKRSNLDCGVNISGENVGKRGGSEGCYDAPCEGFGYTSRASCMHAYRLLMKGLRKKCYEEHVTLKPLDKTKNNLDIIINIYL